MSGFLRGAGSPVPNVRVKSERGSRESTGPSEKPSKRARNCGGDVFPGAGEDGVKGMFDGLKHCFNAIDSSNNQGNSRQQGERHEASSNGTQQADPANEPINLSRFCDLLQDHAQGSVQCKGADSVMLFGSTGVGKSTALHLLAGAKFSFEAVELAPDESAADEFGGPDTELQLITQKKIPGCVIGNSATSTTMLLNSYHDSVTGLTYIDTPGFNNVGDDDDTTIDAANSAAIMSTIRNCSTLRVVFLISVRDELNTAKAGQIKRLFELMGKFIVEAEKRMPSVLMLFTHCDGFSRYQDIIGLLNKIGRAKALPENLMPFLRLAIHLLNTHQEALLIFPAAEDAQHRMDQVRNLLMTTVEPITDTAAALQCPLSQEVRTAIENVCGSEKEQIFNSLQNNRLLTDARSHLECLHLLHDNLRLPAVESIYKSALHLMVSEGEKRKQLLIDDLQRESFSQVRTSLSIFNCDLSILSSHMAIIGPGDVLKTLMDVCVRSISSTCDMYDHKLDEALEKDDFDAVVTVLRHCGDMLEHLKEYLPTRRQKMISCGAHTKVRARTICNKAKARTRIREKQLDAELCCLLDTIRKSSHKFSDAEWPAINQGQIMQNETDCLVEADYAVVSAEMNTMLTDIAEKLKTKFKPDADVSTNSIIKAFMDKESSTADALSQIDSADQLCSRHIRHDAREARTACREAFSVLKDTAFERLRDAIENFKWKKASPLFDSMHRAGKLGSEEERRTVESRLEDMKNSANTNLSKLVNGLSAALDRDDFRSFVGSESSLGDAIRLPAESGLCKALQMCRFKLTHEHLLSQMSAKITQVVSQCKVSFKDHDFSDVMVRIRMLNKMAEALSVARETDSGCVVPDFNKRIVELLQHVHDLAKCEVDQCKLLVAQLHDPLKHSTESEVEHLNSYLQTVQQLRTYFSTLKGHIPSLTAAAVADWDEQLFRMLQDSENHLSERLQSYAMACRDRCLSSLAAEPKPLAEDVVNFLKTLTICQKLDPFLTSLNSDEGAAGTQPFGKQRKSVRDAVKQKFTELRDACSRDMRADRMANAQANLERANEMQALRDEFAGDAITFDAALQEMRSSFEQKSGTFVRSVDNALSQERFSELHKLLLGYRDLKGAAEQQEYNSALSRLIEVGDGKYTAALQIISTINDDARGRSCNFPPDVEQIATSLRWIEGARCLGVGEDAILPVEVSAKWQSAFQNMTNKLGLLKAHEAKLTEWKFATVEEMHRRFGQLLLLRFPEEISETITRMNRELSAALDAKVAGLDSDLRKALENGDHLLLDLIFTEVQTAKDADSSFINTVRFISLVQVIQNFLRDLVESIKDHFMKFEIREAHSKQQQLWNLEKATVVRPYVAHTGLDKLAEQKKSSMITRSWLSEGHVKTVKAKLMGFRDVDPVHYETLVVKFMDSLEGDIKRLRKVDTTTGVIEVGQIVLQIPRFAIVLDGEQPAFKKWLAEIWNSFFESVHKMLRFISGPDQHDISDSICFLQEARKLLQQNVTRTVSSTATPNVTGGGRLDVAHANDACVNAGDAFEPNDALSLPLEDVHRGKVLIEKLDNTLAHFDVDIAQIDDGWKRLVEKFDCQAEGKRFDETLKFICQLKRQALVIRTSGEYAWGKQMPTPERAVAKLFLSVSEQVDALDTSRPEECAVFLQNLQKFDQECKHVIDDECELQQLISKNIKSYLKDADVWIEKVTEDFMKKSTEKYRQAQAQHGPDKRKALLNEVNKVMEQHQLLVEKLMERGIRQNNGTDSPLVAQIKSEISEKTEHIRQRLTGGHMCTVEDVATSIHEIYVAAMDLGNTIILKHSESSIALILQDCLGKSRMGLAELGIVLERDLPQGGEIVAHLPQFAEYNRRAFQEMTSGKTPEGTVEEVAKLNNLTESHARTLLVLVQQVFGEYDKILKSSSFYYDRPTIVGKIQKEYEMYHKIPALIGGVFAVWSLESKTEQCPTLRRPLPAQVVAIVRLLALDDQLALERSEAGGEGRTEPAAATKKRAQGSDSASTKPRKRQRGEGAGGRGISRIPGMDYLASCYTSLLECWYKSESRIDASHLAQIKTGQGKSVVLGTLATVLSISGFYVDCVCYSAYLSERDRLDFQAIFELFGVSHMVQYGTFQKLSERLVNSDGNVREMARDLILSSKKVPDSKSKKPSKGKEEKTKRILLVDEVDVFFSRSFYGETYDPVEYLKISEITELQKKAWSMRDGDTKHILPALKSMEAYQTLMNQFSEVKAILEVQINVMIDDLKAWKNEDSSEPFTEYKIIDGIVAYKSGVCYDTTITFNYVTLWTYFHEVECKRVSEVALEERLGLMIKCGQFSYAEIPKCYQLILGVTGTLVPETKDGPHPLGTFEQEIIRDDYRITGKTELPSVFGERILTFRENEHVSVQKDEDSYNNAISLEVAKAVEGRAVLVFFESEDRLEAWQDSPYGQRVPEGTTQCIKSDTRDITVKVRKATHAGQVTLLSREHGRGLDFHCTDKKVDELGGLHVVQTFLSEELSEEIQIRGRTARQKNKGSFQIILLAKDLEKFEISDDEIDQKEKGLHVPVLADADAAPASSGVTQQTMYEFLHAKRAVFLDKSSATRREAVLCAKALHDKSAAFQEDLLTLSHAQAHLPHLRDKCLKFLRGCNIVQAKCRLLCLSDATASMSSVWGKTQESIRTMLERISEISGGSGNIEVKWLAFRDYEHERSKVIEASPWTDDPASLVKFVGSIRCISGNGCDWPEAVEAALQYANNDPKQQATRVLLIGDAPPHQESKGEKIAGLKVHASNLEDGGYVAGGVLSTDYREECTRLNEKKIRVFSFYLDDLAKDSFDEIARLTGGESKKLDCKNAELLVHAVCETALEDIGGSAMQERYRAQYRAA